MIPLAAQLQVTDERGTYNKLFSWEYEGPVNGMGTFCEPCAGDPEEAMQLIRIYCLTP